MVHGDSGEKRSLLHFTEELPQRIRRDPLSPVLPAIPVGNFAQALSNKAADFADNDAIALNGALNREWVRENARPVSVEFGAFA
jgi:hypothetical protein